MSKPFIALCPEITRANALNLIDWLEDEAVIRYLSDSRQVSQSLSQVLNRVQLPVLTHLFNQGGRFFMAYDRDDRPVGFVRLVKSGCDCEMVLVIGDRENWGRKLGPSAIREGMKIAFFEMRADRLIAKIHAENARSLNAFLGCGFVFDHETPSLKTYTMPSHRYLQQLRTGVLRGNQDIHVTEIDQSRLRQLLALAPEPEVFELEHEVERAIVVEPNQVGRDVLTMNSRARVHLDGDAVDLTLVYPQDADDQAGKVSVFSPIGTALLGYREGDAVDWRIDNRTRRLQIDKLVYQPEAAGDFHL